MNRKGIVAGLILSISTVSYAEEVTKSAEPLAESIAVLRVVTGAAVLEDGSNTELKSVVCFNNPALANVRTALLDSRLENDKLIKQVNEGIDKANGTVSVVVPIVAGLAGLIAGVVITGAIVAATSKH